MEPICCDTSFLFALYGSDLHTAKAISQVRKLTQSLTLSIFNEFELENALRFAAFRKFFPADKVIQFRVTFELDRKFERVVVAPCSLPAVLAKAAELSARYTQSGGHRSFDILHVAAALEYGAGTFLTFDANQRKLAQAVGLRSNP